MEIGNPLELFEGLLVPIPAGRAEEKFRGVARGGHEEAGELLLGV